MHSTIKRLCRIWISFLPILFVWTPTSCSIKEDRVDCPCLLTLHLEDAQVKRPGEPLYLYFIHEQMGLVHQATLQTTETEYDISLPKGSITTFVSTEGTHWTPSEDGKDLHLQQGNEADSIYAHTSVVECISERAEATICLHKQWCTARIIMNEPDKWESSLFEIRSNWSGLSIDQLEAVKGSFSCVANKVAENMLLAEIPRQGDNSLTLKIVRHRGERTGKDSEGNAADPEEILQLGEMISSIGYDWRKADLDDLIIRLSDTKTGISFEIVDWNDQEVQDGTQL